MSTVEYKINKFEGSDNGHFILKYVDGIMVACEIFWASELWKELEE